ncbi:MAG: hypothetical protein EXS49_00770 [Candidatus Pacebacteria bacterium]|nr:hypothetical protein [Candidatus Paceibacterota bacterium]
MSFGKFLEGDRKLKLLVNFWTLALWALIIIDFFLKNKFDGVLGVMSAVYSATLSLYVGTKEFKRWHQLYDGRHPGEIFIICWTVLIFGLLLLSMFLGYEYKVAVEVVADYVVVLSVFAITQESKKLYKKACGK